MRPGLVMAASLSFLAPFLAGLSWPAPGRDRGLQVRPGHPAREARVALVIGNGAYLAAPLNNPVNDARAIADTLETCGFAVARLENGTRSQMREAIRQFGGRIKGGGVGLFYFAGHGIQLKGRNYLVPVGADGLQEDEVEARTVGLEAVLSELEAARNRLNILVLDACRDNPFGTGQQGFTQVDAPAGTFLAFATAPGRTAADGSGGNSTYTAALLRQLKTPGLKLEEVFKRTRAEVLVASGRRQTPWENSSVVGDFCFLAGGAPPAEPAVTAVVQPVSVPVPAMAALPPPPAAVAQVGGLQVLVDTPGAQVYLDGALKGTASPASALNLPDLPPGDVQVRVESAGLAPVQRAFSIEPGRWTQARLSLRRPEEPGRPDPRPGMDAGGPGAWGPWNPRRPPPPRPPGPWARLLARR